MRVDMYSIGLWDIAVDRLNPEDRRYVDFEKSATLSMLENLLKAAKEKRALWSYTKNGKKVILRDLVGKVIAWVEKFIQIGDIAMNYNVAHAALPWAGVRFFLKVGGVLPNADEQSGNADNCIACSQ
jgi:hypothetical protein